MEYDDFSSIPDRPTEGGGVGSSTGFFDFLKLENIGDLETLAKYLGAGAVAGSSLGLFGDNQPDIGYQGSIPNYTAVRKRVPNTFDPNRRPGSGGQRYFTDSTYVDMDKEGATQSLADAIAAADLQATGLATTNLANLARETLPVRKTVETSVEDPLIQPSFAAVPTAQSVLSQNMSPSEETSPFTSPYQSIQDDPTSPLQVTPYKTGGIAELRTKEQKGGIAELGTRKQRYLDGETDGMADKVPATIDNEDPAALSDGEYVIPADVVSHLGNGNSDAGAKVLDEMLSRVREARTGDTEQAPEINPKEFLPA